MQNTLKGLVLFKSIFLFSAVAITSGCVVSEEFVETAGTRTKVTKVLIQDSFERDNISAAGNAIHWRGFIWDWGSPVVGSSGRNVAAVIVGPDVLGEASDGEKALYFYGREGHSIHEIYLITQTFDLTEASEVELSFDYLTFMLNDAQDVVDGVDEYLKVEVCSGEKSECGVGETLNATNLKGGPWQAVFNSDGSEMPSGLNGKNHRSNDWQRANISLDISQFTHKSHFTFRVTAKMRDGFKDNKMSKAMEDGAAIDNISAVGVRYEIVGGPENPNDPNEDPNVDDPTCDETLPFTNPGLCDYIPVVEIDV